MSRAVVVTRNLSKIFRVGFFARRVVAVKDVSMEVHEGEVFGLLGPNGAGKTTTMKMLMGFVEPTSGSAEIMGHPAGSPLAKHNFGYLPENPALYEFLRGDEFLVYLGRLSGLGHREARKRSEELLELVGLSGRGADRQIRRFSKGMVQRLAIAQALISDPAVVMLDEPMSGLDPVGRKDVRDLIFTLKEQGKTVFFSTHILSDVELICDRVGIISQGVLTDIGKLSELVDSTVREVELVLQRVSPELRAQLDPEGQALDRHDGFVLRLSNKDEAQKLATLALSQGAHIAGFTLHRQTLEDLFVDRARGISQAA